MCLMETNNYREALLVTRSEWSRPHAAIRFVTDIYGPMGESLGFTTGGTYQGSVARAQRIIDDILCEVSA